MARVTVDEVKLLLDITTAAYDTNVALFIDQATMVVNEDLVPVAPGLSNARLKMIELNLAAHYGVLSLEKGGFTYQRAGEAMDGYRGNASQVKLSSTRFGQQAISLDPSGKLAAMDSPRGTAEFKVYGSTYDRGYQF